MLRLVKVGTLYEGLGVEAVNEIAAWLDQVYDAKTEMNALPRDVEEVLRELRAVHLELVKYSDSTCHSRCNATLK